MGNTFGHILKFTSFGESHGVAIGGVLDGCPAGVYIDLSQVQSQLDRRRPGQSKLVSQRKESDRVKILSGIFEGKTTGMPIGFILDNEDPKSKDYSHLKESYRPSHADFTYQKKYGIRDYRGGGRSSARETATRVAAGAIAQQILSNLGISITSYVTSVGEINIESENIDLNTIDENLVRCPNVEMAIEMENYISKVKASGDTVGGVIHTIVKNTPIGLGEPVYDKLSAALASAMFSINAVKGFELGSGFKGSKMKGSIHNDPFIVENGTVKTETNFSGGIQGGISNGEDIYFNVAFKPVATILQKQSTINDKEHAVIIEGKGRHDACVVPRAVPIVESMTALVILDYYLLSKSNKA
ncbi:MAG: chorismate synthase [Crocinitomicaceae bacterium]